MSAICFECEKEITDPDDVFCRECLTDANDSMEAWVEKFVAEKRELEVRVAELRNELATAQDGEVYFERLYEEVKTARNRLLVALEQVEWVAGGGDCGPVCAWCDASQPYHAPNCDRQSAIGRAKGEAR